MGLRSPSAAEVSLSLQALEHLGAVGGVSNWPEVLGLASDGDAPRGPISDVILGEMRAFGLVDDSARPTSWAQATLAALAVPDAQIDIHITDATAVHRACLVRRGADHVFAVRSDDTIDLSVPHIVDVDDVGAVVGSVFGVADVPQFVGISVPTNELRDRLDRCECAGDYVACFCAVGATQADARAMSLAFQTCRTQARLIATATTDGVRSEAPGTVSIYDTDHGRIVAEPCVSPDGRMWTTLAPGSHARLGRAVHRMLETLHGPGWMP